jgi:3-oxoacyl-[acyl-carrier protein] reductase
MRLNSRCPFFATTWRIRLLGFTSGQYLGPMEGELAYAVAKGALNQVTATLAKALSPTRIVANCINPGPVDTGYADPSTRADVSAMFSDGRWGMPENVADLVEVLVGDRGAWIRGQAVNTEGGFDRYA